MRIPLVYTLPVDVMVGLSTAMMIAAMLVHTICTGAYVTRAARRVPELEMLLPGGRRRSR